MDLDRSRRRTPIAKPLVARTGNTGVASVQLTVAPNAHREIVRHPLPDPPGEIVDRAMP
jgi:hypothetical protein